MLYPELTGLVLALFIHSLLTYFDFCEQILFLPSVFLYFLLFFVNLFLFHSFVLLFFVNLFLFHSFVFLVFLCFSFVSLLFSWVFGLFSSLFIPATPVKESSGNYWPIIVLVTIY